MSDPPLILVVDDEVHIVHVVSLKLQNAGFEVVAASDGQEGLDTAAQVRPDLIITDYQMPVMSGLQFCKEMRNREPLKNIPAIMLTARGFDIEPQEMIDAGIAECLAKPFSPRGLLQSVNELLHSMEAKTAAEKE